ncbi:MAG: hypothetical protein KKH41_05820 [Candidatus Thermoplasmatota archaeon]|nr:hypothetical protein [Candidatus Thermoplasmatota archaeon]MBU4072004.1 hypothetical protein [Candidatus Thermoplasmatota archaeon]MBU4144535.1 hypothetical protein [Candidatus Thermoplasmatota archaeon]MBU4592084.1 hypothetical protein [Candidatus Thermoplasmatota archaeon]
MLRTIFPEIAPTKKAPPTPLIPIMPRLNPFSFYLEGGVPAIESIKFDVV